MTWLSLARSSWALVEPANRTIANPSRYLPRSESCSTKPRDSSTAINRETVDLCTPSSAAISVTPAAPNLPRISITIRARSTDCTAATDFSRGGTTSVGSVMARPVYAGAVVIGGRPFASGRVRVRRAQHGLDPVVKLADVVLGRDQYAAAPIGP